MVLILSANVSTLTVMDWMLQVILVVPSSRAVKLPFEEEILDCTFWIFWLVDQVISDKVLVSSLRTPNSFLRRLLSVWSVLKLWISALSILQSVCKNCIILKRQPNIRKMIRPRNNQVRGISETSCRISSMAQVKRLLNPWIVIFSDNFN